MDTGSNYTAVPRAMLDRLKVPGNESVPSRLADGSTVMVDVKPWNREVSLRERPICSVGAWPRRYTTRPTLG